MEIMAMISLGVSVVALVVSVFVGVSAQNFHIKTVEAHERAGLAARTRFALTESDFKEDAETKTKKVGKVYAQLTNIGAHVADEVRIQVSKAEFDIEDAMIFSQEIDYVVNDIAPKHSINWEDTFSLDFKVVYCLCVSYNDPIRAELEEVSKRGFIDMIYLSLESRGRLLRFGEASPDEKAQLTRIAREQKKRLDLSAPC